MSIELKVPPVGESVTEVEIGEWLKAEGDHVEKDENVVVIETEKATVELPAPASGRLARIRKQKGDSANVGDVIGEMEEADGATETPKEKKHPVQRAESPGKKSTKEEKKPQRAEAPKQASEKEIDEGQTSSQPEKQPATPARVMPAAQRALEDRGLRAEEVKATGPGGRLLKEDVQRHPDVSAAPTSSTERVEQTVRMSLWRRTIARRLVQAKQEAALLTTFNEIDMSAVAELRKAYGEAFQKKYNVKLGLMSFFVKAAVDALNQLPQVNAEVRDENIVYRNYCDIGIAVATGKGLVVPVLPGAERLSFAEIERAIADFASRAQENKLEPEELEGGTFTITNGGVFGSLLSTPIVNPPQSAILGLHAIQDRPVAREGQVVIRPMMYVALTYDHRIVDGREAVTFLRRIKEIIENPARMLIEV